MPHRTPAARRWRALVDAQTASGLSTKVFAAQRNLNPSTLSWWRSRLKREDPAPSLRTVPATVFTEIVVAEPDRTVVLAFDHLAARVVVNHDTDLALLRRVLEAVA